MSFPTYRHFAQLALLIGTVALPAGPVVAQKNELVTASRLDASDSPYVRRHRSDAVDWYEWGEEAFEKARKENKPVLVSIGYDSCHWCHRMQTEAFADPGIVAFLNKHFVCVLVDRERRPDLNAVYMTYMNANHGQAGWPINVWVTPDYVPFSVGSYFPSRTTPILPGMMKVLRHIEAQWSRFPDYINAQSARDLEKLKARLAELDTFPDDASAEEGSDLTKVLEAAYEAIAARYDPLHGGFTHPAQFPQPGLTDLLLTLQMTEPPGSFRGRQAAKMAMHTASALCNGGVTDHVGGGFHRYALDAAWEVPRFEKMLHVQARVSTMLLDVFRLSDDPRHLEAARRALEFAARELSSPDGAFYGSLHSDSAAAGDANTLLEGAFYVWTYDELKEAIDRKDFKIVSWMLDVKPGGNLTPGSSENEVLAGKNVIRRKRSVPEAAKKFGVSRADAAAAFSRGLAGLSAARRHRPRPARDENIVTDWNAYMISAFTALYEIGDNPAHLERAKRAAAFILRRLYDATSGTLYHTLGRDGTPSGVFARDHAALIASLLDLYAATFDEQYVELAVTFQAQLDRKFWDSENGGYFETLEGIEDVVLRLKNFGDDSEPATNSLAARNLVRLSDLLGDPSFLGRATKTREFARPRMVKYPTSTAGMLSVARLIKEPARIIVIHGEAESKEVQSALRETRRRLLPRTTVILRRPGDESGFIASRNRKLAALPKPTEAGRIFVTEDYDIRSKVVDAVGLALVLDGR